MPVLEPRPPFSRIVWIVSLALVALVLSTAGRYGIFRDEYYYLMCADHPAWGYVDHPPFAMFFLTVWKAIFGSTVIALRVPPSLLVGAVSLGAGALAREMRGGGAAQVLASVAAGLAPGILALGGFYSMNAFDVAFWVLTAFIVCRLLDPAADRRWWWGLGLTVGLGILNKYSLVFLGVGLGLGILMSPLRRELLSKECLTGSLLVVVLEVPHIVWQVFNDWPTREFIRNAQEHKIAAFSPLEFWSEQLLMAHPMFLPLWVVGAVGLLFLPRLKPWRPLGVAFVVVGVWLTVQKSKPYYMVPAYPMVLAAGSVLVTGWLSRWARVARVTSVGLPVLMTAGGLMIAPLVIPLLSPVDYVVWEQTLGLRPRNAETNEMGALPQHFADRFGWQELATTVRVVVADLSPEDQARCLVVARNYGECGAINYWGLPEGVRPAVSGHNNCYLWWSEDLEPEVVVVVGGSRERAEKVFSSVELAAVHRSELAVPGEGELGIWLCRGLKIPPAEVRDSVREFI